jgi:hypothetical protein
MRRRKRWMRRRITRKCCGIWSHFVISEARRALALLANDPNGATEATLVEQGFSIPMLARLVVDGLVVARHEAGGRTLDVVRVKITDAGRAALKECQ